MSFPSSLTLVFLFLSSFPSLVSLVSSATARKEYSCHYCEFSQHQISPRSSLNPTHVILAFFWYNIIDYFIHTLTCAYISWISIHLRFLVLHKEPIHLRFVSMYYFTASITCTITNCQSCVLFSNCTSVHISQGTTLNNARISMPKKHNTDI